jgi:type VI secretion system protein ImpH
MLREYFQLPIEVRQFQGQWLRLEAVNQSRLGGDDANNQAGVNLVAGDRVWDVQNKIRIRLGPLTYEQFNEFLPDQSPVPERKAFFLLAHLVRLYIGPAVDFDVQLILKASEVPGCLLLDWDGRSPQLGWNTWTFSKPLTSDVDDPVFEGEEIRWIVAPK